MASEKAVHDLMDDFRRLVHALRTSHRAAEHLSLTAAQLFILSVLEEAGAPLSVNDVARATRTDQSTVSKVTARMIEAGLVLRQRAAEDSRRVELSPSPRGRALLRRAPRSTAQQRLIDELARFRPADAATLSRLLGRLLDALGVAEEPPQMLFEDEPSKTRKAAQPKRRR